MHKSCHCFIIGIIILIILFIIYSCVPIDKKTYERLETSNILKANFCRRNPNDPSCK